MFKWLFLAFLTVLVIVLTSYLKGKPRDLPKACFALGFLPFFMAQHLYVAPYAWLGWMGPAKGFEISILDAVALAIILATKRTRIPLPITIGFAVYVVALLIATTSAVQPVPSLFYVWQIIRIALIFVAVARASAANTDAAVGIAAGLGAAVMIQAIAAANQFAGGAIQAGGTVGHQNELGVLTNFAVMPAFAMLLAGHRNKLAATVLAAGAIVAVTGASRATLGLFGAGLLLTALLSLRYRQTSRKMVFIVAGGLAMAAAVPVMMWAIDRRSDEALASSNEQRDAMNRAADMIIADHPFGIGPNQYVSVAIRDGYSQRAGVTWASGIRGNPVHNAYALIRAESGYLGIFGVILILGSFLIIGLRSLRPAKIDDRTGVVVGMFAASIVGMVHANFEWVSIAYSAQVVLVMSMGAVVGRIGATRSRTATAKRRRPLIETPGSNPTGQSVPALTANPP